jgi:hypothetical protein
VSRGFDTTLAARDGWFPSLGSYEGILPSAGEIAHTF